MRNKLAHISGLRGVAQLASSWVRSTRNFSTDVDPDRAFHSTDRPLQVSWACGPRLEASRATQRLFSGLADAPQFDIADSATDIGHGTRDRPLAVV